MVLGVRLCPFYIGIEMNERIRQLAEQAQKVIWPAEGYVTELTDLDVEKFAELIVKECADYVQFYYKDHMCEVIAHDMKQHFGVEEW